MTCTCPICTEREALREYIIDRLNSGSDPAALMQVIGRAEFQVVDEGQITSEAMH